MGGEEWGKIRGKRKREKNDIQEIPKEGKFQGNDHYNLKFLNCSCHHIDSIDDSCQLQI